MKNLLLIAIAIFGFSAASFGQVTGTGDATALIVTPISISNDASMNFGKIAVLTGTGGTAILSTSGGVTAGGAGGVTIPPTQGGSTAAGTFAVHGAADYTFSIGISESCIVSDGSGHSMTINTFNSNPATTGTLNGTGDKTVLVGATLNVAAGQAAGTYLTTNTGGTSYSVTVNYN